MQTTREVSQAASSFRVRMILMLAIGARCMASENRQSRMEVWKTPQGATAARLLAIGLTADFAGAACAGAESHPPAGAATLTASSGWGSGVKVWIASLAAASDWASRRLAISSRFRADSA